jgi:catechol 2,3-dioxygenase-like lactoylglutathione lyase family enzyme
MAVIRPAIHHVTIKTSRMDQMIEWYGTVVGAKVQFRDQGACCMTNDEANHRVAFLTVPGLSDDSQKVSQNGVHHFAFEYDSFDDLMSSFNRMRAEGIEPAFCLDHGLTCYRKRQGRKPDQKKRLIVGITGASAAVYGIRLLELRQCRHRFTFDYFAPAPRSRSPRNYFQGCRYRSARRLVHSNQNIGNASLSGSFHSLLLVAAPSRSKTMLEFAPA